jgi:hypothetical protein
VAAACDFAAGTAWALADVAAPVASTANPARAMVERVIVIGLRIAIKMPPEQIDGKAQFARRNIL